MSPISPHRPISSAGHSLALPNIKQEIHSDDLIETLHQFHQQQRDYVELRLDSQELSDDEDDKDQENEDNSASRYFQKQNLNSDDIIVPVSTNTQPNLQFPPSFHPFNTPNQDNGATINLINAKLHKNPVSSGSTTQELYPALQFESGSFITTIPESFSNSTISSFESVPPTLTHSITNSFSTTSLQMSPLQPSSSQQQQLQTPARASRKHSISNGVPALQVQTPLQSHSSNIPSYQTPLRKTPTVTPHRKSIGHQRTRSRLSADANGSATISTTTLKSPGGGVNPFYTPPSFLSPGVHNHSLDTPRQLGSVDSSSHIATPFSTPVHTSAHALEGSSKSGVSPYLIPRKTLTKAHKRFKSGDLNEVVRNHELSLLYGTETTSSDESSSAQPRPQHHFDKVVRSRSTINLSTNMMNQANQENEQYIPAHPRHNLSIPQNLYTQFDKLNFIPEIQQQQHQPYAPLVQFPTNVVPISSAPLLPVPSIPEDHSFQDKDLETRAVEIVVDVDDKKEKKQKMHQCPLCGSRFQRPEHVKRHMRSHSSEKPYSCTICNKRFNRNDNMKAHERKIHGIEKGKMTGET